MNKFPINEPTREWMLKMQQICKYKQSNHSKDINERKKEKSGKEEENTLRPVPWEQMVEFGKFIFKYRNWNIGADNHIFLRRVV